MKTENIVIIALLALLFFSFKKKKNKIIIEDLQSNQYAAIRVSKLYSENGQIIAQFANDTWINIINTDDDYFWLVETLNQQIRGYIYFDDIKKV